MLWFVEKTIITFQEWLIHVDNPERMINLFLFNIEYGFDSSGPSFC
jgi:hypothetical protein